MADGQTEIVARFVGDGEAYLPGLPMRDVTLAEINRAGLTLVDVLEARAYGRPLYATPDTATDAQAPKSIRRHKAAEGVNNG